MLSGSCALARSLCAPKSTGSADERVWFQRISIHPLAYLLADQAVRPCLTTYVTYLLLQIRMKAQIV